MIKRDDIVATARQYLGVRFQRGGRDKTLDCVGLLLRVGRDLGLEFRETTLYCNQPHPAMISEYVESQTERREWPGKQGMIVILRQTIMPIHTGILVKEGGNYSVINANTRHRKVVEEPWDVWRENFISVRDYRGVEA